MFKRFSNTRARAPCNPRRGAVFAPKWAKKFCKPALRQLAKFRVHSRSIAIKNRALVSFSALSRLFALIYPTPSAFYHSSRKLTICFLFVLRLAPKSELTGCQGGMEYRTAPYYQKSTDMPRKPLYWLFTSLLYCMWEQQTSLSPGASLST